MTNSILPTGCNKPFSHNGKDLQIIPSGDLEQDNIGRKQQTKQKTDRVWSTEYSVDELFLNLVKVRENITNSNGKTIPVRKYYRLALQLMNWIPIVRLPSNEFVIYISDLSPGVKKDIESIIDTPKTLRYVLIQAVGRIFENLNFEYYHLSVARNLKVRIEP